MVTTGEVDVVIAYDLDRLLGRDELGQVLVKCQILDAGARIEYVQGGRHDGDPGDGDLFTGMKALWARHENSQRMNASVTASVVVWKPVIRGRLDKAHPTATVTSQSRTMAPLRSSPQKPTSCGISSPGWSRRASRRAPSRSRLHDLGIPTRADLQRASGRDAYKTRAESVWAPSTVTKLLNNPIYTGANSS